MIVDLDLTPRALGPDLARFWPLAAGKARGLLSYHERAESTPVFTVAGRYTARGWTEWTQGFQLGLPLLVYEVTGQTELLADARALIERQMPAHLTHFGVHDHGFNTVSTYGNLLRMARRGDFAASPEEQRLLALAIGVSGAVQAKRWTPRAEGGYLYSFNGPHSLFVDTLRTCRVLVAAHLLGHRSLDEGDAEVDLRRRAMEHARTTARYAVYYGEARDIYDQWGRVAHESIFNVNDGAYRCPNSQQGYSGFSTWTRGLAWAMLGFGELLELPGIPAEDRETFVRAARATCDFYLANTSADGIPYWDTGAPDLHRLGNYRERDADPYNAYEPVDGSAAAIGAQGLLRLASVLRDEDADAASRYRAAGLGVCRTLLSDRYLALDPAHEGLLLHSVYHRPNGWDHQPGDAKVPAGESSLWGDYHLTELALLVQRLTEDRYYTFFDHLTPPS